MQSVGIDSISFYIPELRISISDILQHRAEESQKVFESLSQAQINTQQKFLRITKSWQDSATIAAQSTISLLKNTAKLNLSLITYLASATETPLDAAKPLSAYILGILQKIMKIPNNLVNYQTQHACAGGTISILQIAALILTSNKDKLGIVTMSDIARYTQSSTAEITQGAGASSVLISKFPRLLEIDIENVGYASEDVDDFFRPLNSATAHVRGRYSMQCYIDSIYNSLQDYANQINKGILEVIEDNDYIVCHTPFQTMPQIALTNILRKKLNLSKEQSDEIIEKKQINMMSEIAAYIGNTYTAATYFPLAYLLEKETKRLSAGIIGKKILLLSYGAGNTSVVLQMQVAKQALEIINTWNLNEQLDTYTDISIEEYIKWCINSEGSPAPAQDFPLQNTRNKELVYLEKIRDDLYRTYNIQE